MKFEFVNPTRVVFGIGSLARLGAETARIGHRALLVTGGGSVKRSGVFRRAIESLEKAGVAWTECAGVEPNPRLTTVVRGASQAREHGSEVVVALGGGSVMDASKVMAAAVHYEGDPWDMMFHGERRARPPRRALPVVTVPTLAATGSEMNDGAVITNEKTVEKSFVIADCLYPRAAILDPALTASVPPDQTAYGIADLVTHVTESYFNGVDGTPLQDRWTEGVVEIAMEYGPRAVRDGGDLEARTQILWASTVALNGWIGAACGAPYPVHMIEHVLSAHTDVAHGAGLAIVSPAWMRFAARTRPERFAQFARRVPGLRPESADDAAAAAEGIDGLEAFFRSLGCPTRLSQAGIRADGIARFAADAVRVGGAEGRVGGRPPAGAADVEAILRACA